MVKPEAIMLIFLLTINSIYGQDSGKEIKNYVHFSTFIKNDTLRYHDTLEVNIELTNITNNSIIIYPEGIVYLRVIYTDFHKELVLITDRKTGRLEKRLLPNEKVLLQFDVLINESSFPENVSEFSVIFITFPYWLKKKDRNESIFGRWESEIKKIVIL